MKVSVALCTYNAERFLNEQLKSILHQHLPVDEITICDDGSTDQTHHLINQYQEKYPSLIKFKINEHNLGPRKNFEQAISLATGDVIFLCDQDDIWPANKVEEVVACFREHPDALGVFTNGQLMNEQGEAMDLDLWTSFLFTPKMQEQLTRDTLFRMIIQNWTIVTGAALAIRKEAKEFILPFRHMDDLWHDEWIGYRLSVENALIPLNRNLFSYRIHANQQIGVFRLEDTWQRARRRESFFFHTATGQEGFHSIGFKMERLKLGKRICSYFPQNKNLVKVLEDDLANEKKRIFNSLSFVKRKLLLLKWVLERRNNTSIHELASL